MRQAILPVETQPMYVALDGTNIFLTLLARVRIVEAQKRLAVRFLAHAKVQADRHDVPHVQIAVRFRWESRYDLPVFSGLKVVVNNLADEIPRCLSHGLVDVQLEGPLFYAFLTEISGATTVQ